MLNEAYCSGCQKTVEIKWLEETVSMGQWRAKQLQPRCVTCNKLNWEAMAHLNRKNSAYCESGYHRA